MKDRIAIIGAGRVGSETANEILRRNIGDCVMLDLRGPWARGAALDMTHSAPLRHSSVSITGTTEWADIAGSSVVVVAAGQARKPGMSRDDLLDVNLSIIREVCNGLMRHAPDAVWIMVTNPLDAMTYAALRLSGKDRRTVIGMAGMLDAARFRANIAQALDVSAEDVQGMVLGSHGDLMVPLVRFATVSGIPAADLLDAAVMEQVLARTRNAGTELVGLLKTGSAYYAAGASVADMVDAVIHDSHRVVCSSTMCTGEFGIDGVCVGVPVVLGSGGVQRVLPLRLDGQEQQALSVATEHLRAMQVLVDKKLAA